MQDWVAIQHDGKGEVITVTDGIKADTYEAAESVVRDMMRRSGTRGRLVLVKADSLKTHGLSL